jgi:hypothetical protein
LLQFHTIEENFPLSPSLSLSQNFHSVSDLVLDEIAIELQLATTWKIVRLDVHLLKGQTPLTMKTAIFLICGFYQAY